MSGAVADDRPTSTPPAVAAGDVGAEESASDVVDNGALSRFELAADGEIAFAVYQGQGATIIFTHTQVPPALEGRGVGSMLIAGALGLVRIRGQSIVPTCAFVARYVATHPGTQDLLAP